MVIKSKILIVEHDPHDLELIKYELNKGGISYVSEVVQNEKDYGNALRNFEPDIILSDYALPFFDGPTAFRIREDIASETPFIFVSGTIGEENSIEFVKKGITDYALKDKLFTLATKVKRALEESRAKKEKNKIELERKQNERQLGRAQQLAHLGSWEMDYHTHLMLFSEEACRIYGLPPDQRSQSFENWLSFIDPSDLEFAKNKLQQAFETATDSSFNFRFKRLDGMARIGCTEWRFEFKKNGTPIRLYGILQDITEQEETKEKVNKANRLYTFISQVNQNIVRVKDEQDLFHNACRIACEFGKFKMAWIGIFEEVNKRISLVDQFGIPAEDIPFFQNALCEPNGPQDQVLQGGSYYSCDDVQHDFKNEKWRRFGEERGIQSYLIVPINRSGKVIGTFNLYSTEIGFFDKEELALLVEVTNDISFALDLFEKSKQHQETEALVVRKEKQFRHTLDSMLEGIQIHDFNWRYLYVNNALVKYSTFSKEGLLGYTIMEKYPGVEQSDIFKAMQRCMIDRVSEHLESEFVFPDGSKAYFELSIDPIPEGIFVLSVDRSEQKRAKEKLLKVNRLYAFISAVNQSIVHISNEQELLNNACNIAVDIGQFKMAWIEMADEHGKLNLVSIRGTEAAMRSVRNHARIDYKDAEFSGTPTGRVLNSGQHAVSNDVLHDPTMNSWKEEFVESEIKSSISLPIRKLEKMIGVFCLHSSIENFFDEVEINLLQEATGDISFALQTFEKAKKHKETEELVIKNERRFRSLSEKSADMTTLSTPEGELIYGSPSVAKVLGYSLEEFLSKPTFDFIHPDDIPVSVAITKELLQNPGESYPFQQRLLHKKGNWIWCEGSITNMLLEPGVHALVSNFRDISEKKILEQQQDFDRNNLHALINNTKDLMWSVDRDLKLITSNHAFDEMVRHMSGNPMKKGSDILAVGFGVEELQRFRKYYQRAFSGESFTEIEYSDGPDEYCSEISYYPIFKGEVVVGTACFARDITEQKKAEGIRIRTLEEVKRLSLVASKTDNSVLILDKNSCIEWVNDSFTRMTGYTLSEISGKRPFEFLHGEATDKAMEKKIIEKAKLLRPFTEQILNYAKDGRKYWSRTSITPILNDQGGLDKFVAIQSDVTEQKEFEKKLSAIANELTSLIENANVPIFGIDQNGLIDEWNGIAAELLEYPKDEVVGKKWIELLDQKAQEEIQVVTQKVFTGESSRNLELPFVSKGGKKLIILMSISPRRDNNNNIKGAICVGQDISEVILYRQGLEKLVQERTSELHEALKKEKDLLELKNKFVSIASHEFRTPLSTISFAAESIRNYFHQLTADEIQRKLIKIEDQASHMTNLLEDILTIGKSEAGKIKVKRVSLDLKAFIESLIEEVRSTVKEKREIEFKFLCAKVNVNADDKLLRNVVSNLLTNALKFSAADSKVTIVVSDFKGEVLIEVTDRGIGIEKGELSSVFESFQRGSNASAVQGTGLGLSILKKAMELMNGSIKVVSSLGKGSKFSVQIPMK